jgi:hypothetical protein
MCPRCKAIVKEKTCRLHKMTIGACSCRSKAVSQTSFARLEGIRGQPSADQEASQGRQELARDCSRIETVEGHRPACIGCAVSSAAVSSPRLGCPRTPAGPQGCPLHGGFLKGPNHRHRPQKLEVLSSLRTERCTIMSLFFSLIEGENRRRQDASLQGW